MPQKRAEFQPTNEQFLLAPNVIGVFPDDKDPDIIKAPVVNHGAGVKHRPFEFLTVVDPELANMAYEPIAKGLWTDPDIQETARRNLDTRPSSIPALISFPQKTGLICPATCCPEVSLCIHISSTDYSIGTQFANRSAVGVRCPCSLWGRFVCISPLLSVIFGRSPQTA